MTTKSLQELSARLADITPTNVFLSLYEVEDLLLTPFMDKQFVYFIDINTGKLALDIDYDSFTGDIAEHFMIALPAYLKMFKEHYAESKERLVIYHDQVTITVVPFADEVQAVVKPQEFQSIHSYEYPCVVEWFEDDGCTRFELFNTKSDAYDLVHFLNSVDRKPLKVFVFSRKQFDSMMYPILRERGFKSKQRIVSFIVPKLNQTHAGLKMEVNVSYA